MVECEISREKVPLRNAYLHVGQRAAVRVNSGVAHEVAPAAPPFPQVGEEGGWHAAMAPACAAVLRSGGLSWAHSSVRPAVPTPRAGRVGKRPPHVARPSCGPAPAAVCLHARGGRLLSFRQVAPLLQALNREALLRVRGDILAGETKASAWESTACCVLGTGGPPAEQRPAALAVCRPAPGRRPACPRLPLPLPHLCHHRL